MLVCYVTVGPSLSSVEVLKRLFLLYDLKPRGDLQCSAPGFPGARMPELKKNEAERHTCQHRVLERSFLLASTKNKNKMFVFCFF